MIVHAAHAGFWTVCFSAFALGLRHGADPDHLAAIDNLTRNSLRASGRTARFVGALFAGGHSVAVLSIAALAGLLGSHITGHRAGIETAGTWVSIITLFAIGAINVWRLSAGPAGSLASLKLAALPRRLCNASSPLAAIPIGLLFGLGFDTSSQIAAYSLALTGSSGLVFGLIVGLMFALGMAVTDTFDSTLVVRLCARAPLEAAPTTRVWIITVTALAFGVGLYECAQMLGWRSPLPDIALSGLLVTALVIVFAWTLTRTTRVDRAVRSLHVSSVAPTHSLVSRDRPAADYPKPPVSTPHPRTDGDDCMKHTAMRIAGGLGIAALIGAMILYATHPVRGSDHQDSPTTVNRPAADITDVFAYQAPDNPNNIVLQMDVWPLITHGELGKDALDPAVMYQFKIDNTGDGVEDLVLQFQPTSAGPGQTINMFGPGKPNQTGTTSTFIANTGSIAFNARAGGIQANGIKLFVGPTKDPFFFDLLTFFNVIPDRYFGCHAPFANGFSVPCGGATASSFNGFVSAFNTAHGTSCSLTPASDTLSSNQFNVIAIVAEIPKALLLNSAHPIIGVWATTSTTSGS